MQQVSKKKKCKLQNETVFKIHHQKLIMNDDRFLSIFIAKNNQTSLPK